MVDDEGCDEIDAGGGRDRVGYKRPPKAHQFKKGRSGNPRGRRNGSKNFETLVREALTKRITIKLEGKLTTVSVAQAILMRTLRDGIGGSRRAAEQGLRLMERYGLLSEDEEPAYDLTLLDDEELEEFERLMRKSMGQEDEWRAEQAKWNSENIEDRIFGLQSHSEAHRVDDK